MLLQILIWYITINIENSIERRSGNRKIHHYNGRLSIYIVAGMIIGGKFIHCVVLFLQFDKKKIIKIIICLAERNEE